ncbi:hypothetical protein B296_00014480 [Ensete ventricosum]|uniref:Uncharacterized protein n=1 Tax=Ensete ventricosum TaxID=4639 RepID=A0A426Z378_ENSVE|nr:hypothetical protein B296_00014480 [Ensete ventricosum]
MRVRERLAKVVCNLVQASATVVVFCNAWFDGVVVVEFEDAVAGSCTKKTTMRSITQARNTPVRRDGLSFDNEEGAAGSEEQMTRWPTERGSSCCGNDKGCDEGSRKRSSSRQRRDGLQKRSAG